MLCPPLSTDPVVADWIARHRRPAIFLLHMIGIPPTILGVLYVPIYVTALSVLTLLLAFVFFAGGFLIQFLGHGFDRSEPGELAILRRWLRRQLDRRASSGRRIGRDLA